MRIEYINPFVESTLYVLQKITGETIIRENLYIGDGPFVIKDIAALVRISGDVHGRAFIDFDEKAAIDITSVMIQEEQTAITDMTKSSIGELANMITANAVTQLSKYGFQFGISPPEIVSNISQSNEQEKALIVPLVLSEGHVEINVSVKEHL